VIRAAALLAIACGAAQAETWLYRVALDAADPLAARVVVELPAARRAQDFSVQVGGMASGVAPQVADLRCDGVPLAPDSASAWQVQGWNCARLTWAVAMKPAPDGGIDPRSRAGFYDQRARFWLFSDASSLLRPVGDPRHDGQVEFVGRGPVHGSTPVAGTARRRVPAADQAGEFHVIGRLPGASVREGGFDTLHLDADGGDWRRAVAEHARALQYLNRVAGDGQLAPLRSTVVWLAGPTDDAEPVGTAGHRTLLLSTGRREGRMQHPELALAWILREQLQQAMPESLPRWARDSLAQYYAVRALRRSGLPPAAVAAAEKRLIDPARPRQRLLEAQRQAQAGDETARVELRAAGAAFWDRVDRAIVRKSGFRTIDSVLPRLLAAEWPGERLPPAALEQLRRYAGEAAVDELLAFWVGD
jgi:hypothetical protein